MRQKVIRLLRGLHAVSVESTCSVGLPDVNCTLGWIELKVDKWQKHEDPLKQKVSLAHITKQQTLWATMRHQAGGNSWLLIDIDGEWFLLRGHEGQRIKGATRFDLHVKSLAFWKNCPTSDQLILALKTTARIRE